MYVLHFLEKLSNLRYKTRTAISASAICLGNSMVNISFSNSICLTLEKEWYNSFSYINIHGWRTYEGESYGNEGTNLWCRGVLVIANVHLCSTHLESSAHLNLRWWGLRSNGPIWKYDSFLAHITQKHHNHHHHHHRQSLYISKHYFKPSTRVTLQDRFFPSEFYKQNTRLNGGRLVKKNLSYHKDFAVLTLVKKMLLLRWRFHEKCLAHVRYQKDVLIYLMQQVL